VISPTTAPPRSNRIAWRANRRPWELEPLQPAGSTPSAVLALQGRPPMKSAGILQVNQPAQRGLQGGVVGVHVLAVEVHGGLQAQGGRGARPQGATPLLSRLLPEGWPAERSSSQVRSRPRRCTPVAGHEHGCPGPPRRGLPASRRLRARSGAGCEAFARTKASSKGRRPSGALQGEQQTPCPCDADLHISVFRAEARQPGGVGLRRTAAIDHAPAGCRRGPCGSIRPALVRR